MLSSCGSKFLSWMTGTRLVRIYLQGGAIHQERVTYESEKVVTDQAQGMLHREVEFIITGHGAFRSSQVIGVEYI